MTKDQAIAALERAGLTGADGRTCLAHAMVGFATIDDMVNHANQLTPTNIWTRFGQDGGRAAMILRQETT